ncbi:MAG: ribose-phosphate pyrophosphokinase [Candidatus Levybacteria bacterium]|nr:ribose-phosphate pyrophosphokinase [Candidatus Levybacteria bacterium]
MIVVGDPQNKSLSESIADKLRAKIIYPEITVFPDTEQRVRIPIEVVGDRVYVLKSINAPVDSAVLQLSFTVDALIKNGADKVIGVIPYIPYMRADHMFRTGEAVPLEVIINMIQGSGLSAIIMIDPHSIKIPEMFKIPVHDLSALPMFAKKIKEIEPNSNNITIVSPDMGGIRRLKLLDQLLGGVNQVVINKDRNYESGEVRVAEYEGEIRGKCFIIDDIISTGKTVVQAIDTLVQGGALKVYVFATHPVFSENASEILSGSNAEKIFVTDSIPVPEDKKFAKLEVLSISDLIAEAIKKVSS